MTLIEQTGHYQIWAVKEDHGVDYYVYGVYLSGSPRVCPSLGMARAVATKTET